jgi:FkbM family methyltransferase
VTNYSHRVPTEPFVSHAQNREDVVLWRALKDVGAGRYVEVGGNDPDLLSITRSFYDRGWSGLVVEPEPAFAALQRAARPRDVLAEVAITSTVGPVVLQRFAGTGLSTLDSDIGLAHEVAGFERDEVTVAGRRLDDVVEEAGFGQGDVHFMVVDVEGLEADVLATVDLARWRPWVLVIEATRPLSEESTHEAWEPGVVAAGYEFCLFDGLSRFYVAKEHADSLAPLLSHAACIFDDFIEVGRRAEAEQRAALAAAAAASAEAHLSAVEEAAQLRKRLAVARKRASDLRKENERLRRRLIVPRVKRAVRHVVRRSS